MKVIKIFLASSEEMDYDRMVFGNLIRRLDDVYEKRGIRLKLFEWEDYDSAFNDRRKQDEYNENVRESDIFLALFHKKAGQFTIEEFDVASETFKAKSSPKVYAYLKDLKPGEEVSKELEEFKRRMFDEMGHYWCRYDTRDSLQLQFVMQLQLVESSMGDNLVVENGDVRIDGLKVASMDRVKFASSNENYVKMSEELSVLPGKIEKAKERLQKYPDDEDLVEDLQQKLDHYNKLKKEFTEYQDILFDTAKRISRLQGEHITERMRRAMDAFNEGNVREANIILNEAEADAKRFLNDYKQSRMITEQKRQNVICSIKELTLKASTIIADDSYPIEDGVEIADGLFDQAEEMARTIDWDKRQYAKLLFSHGDALSNYSRYTVKQNHLIKAHRLLEETISFGESLFGQYHPSVASACEQLGLIYKKLGDFSHSHNLYEKSLNIWKVLTGERSVEVARVYNQIGKICFDQGDFTSASSIFERALHIHNNCYDDNSAIIASDYYFLGVIYYRMGAFDKALEYLRKSLSIRERLTGQVDPWTLETIGSIYKQNEDYGSALSAYEKALREREMNDPLDDNLLTAFTRDEVSDLRSIIKNK